jgi:hypothetical protein
VAIGPYAGNLSQATLAVAVGQNAGQNSQGTGAVAVGAFAGQAQFIGGQGVNSIAIGARAGQDAQANNSIILNASGISTGTLTANSFTVRPIRANAASVSNILFYNPSGVTGQPFEVTYANSISLSGDIVTTANINVLGSTGFVFGNARFMSGLPVPTSIGFNNSTLAFDAAGGAGPNLNVTISAVANVAVFEGPQAQFDAVRSTGNISTDAYFIGDGSQLTGIPSGYTNANVEAYLPTYTGNLISLQGNVTTTGNIQGSYIIGNGSLLTGIAASLPAQPGNAGKYLSTNGLIPSWQTVAGVFGLTIDGGDADFASTDFVIDAGGA